MESIQTLVIELKLSYIRQYYPQLISEVKQLNKDYDVFLHEILVDERSNRRNNADQTRIREGHFLQKNI